MTTHLKVLAVLTLVMGAFALVGAVICALVFGLIGAGISSSNEENAGIALAILGLGGAALVVTLVVFSVASLLCGWGLLQRRRWARTLGIVIAAVSLIKFPIGTAFGAYALWVLFNKETGPMFGVST